MQRSLLSTVVATLLLLGSVATVQSSPTDSVTTVAVMPFSGASFDSSMLDGFSSALGTKLMGTGRFRVMERAQMVAILREQGLQQSGACEGGECAVEVGKLLSIDHLVVGSVAKVGGIYTISARLVDVETGETRRSTTRNGSTKPETVLTRAIPLVAKDLAGIPAPSDKEIAEKGRYNWIWWTAGGALVAGGAAAALILLAGDDAPATQTAVAQQDEQLVVKMP